MTKELQDILTELNKLSWDIDYVNNAIKTETKKYNELMSRYEKYRNHKLDEQNKLIEGKTIPINLEDFMNELAKAWGTTRENLMLNYHTNCCASSPALAAQKLHKNSSAQLFFQVNEIKASSENTNTRASFISMPLDFGKIQADGLPLSAHCSVVEKMDLGSMRLADLDIDDCKVIEMDIPLDHLLNSDNSRFQDDPTTLAILNAYEMKCNRKAPESMGE